MNDKHRYTLEERATTKFTALKDKHNSDLFTLFKTEIKRAFSFSDFISKTAIQYPNQFEAMLPALIENAAS